MGWVLPRGATGCYTHCVTGNLIIGTDNRVHILTVAHGFTDKPEKYVLLNEKGRPLIFFVHRNQENDGLVNDDVGLVPVGHYDPQKPWVHFNRDPSLTDTIHLHRDLRK